MYPIVPSTSRTYSADAWITACSPRESFVIPLNRNPNNQWHTLSGTAPWLTFIPTSQHASNTDLKHHRATFDGAVDLMVPIVRSCVWPRASCLPAVHFRDYLYTRSSHDLALRSHMKMLRIMDGSLCLTTNPRVRLISKKKWEFQHANCWQRCYPAIPRSYLRNDEWHIFDRDCLKPDTETRMWEDGDSRCWNGQRRRAKRQRVEVKKTRGRVKTICGGDPEMANLFIPGQSARRKDGSSSQLESHPSHAKRG